MRQMNLIILLRKFLEMKMQRMESRRAVQQKTVRWRIMDRKMCRKGTKI